MLKITVKSYKGNPLEDDVSAEFGDDGGTIGRAPDSTLLLPDPDRIISRVHARLLPREGRLVVRDHGTTVPVIVNGRTVGKDNEMRLAQGDEIRIGSYALVVVRMDTSDADDALSDETATMPALSKGTLLSWGEGGAGGTEDRIESFIVPSPPEQATVVAAAPAVTPPVARAATPLVPAATAPLRPAAPAPHASSTSAPAPNLSPAPVQAPAAIPVTTPGSGDRSNSVDELRAALLRGAGVPDLALPEGLTPEFMEQLGRVLRETVQGLLDLLVARAMTKREVRADATIIVAADNNPLKFSPGIDAAIMHLLAPHGQGFMPPLRAITDACDSLRRHQQGFLAGMRAALAASLGRFDPAQLVARAPQASLAESLLPLNHKSKLWNMYEELYDELSKEAEADFHKLFGEEFLRAYQARVQPAAAGRRPGTDA